MNVDDLKAEFFSLINEDDPYKVPRQLDLKNWCTAFSVLFMQNKEKRVPFFLEILSQVECWESNTTIHRVRLNRRIAAGKMIQPRNWKGRVTPLTFHERYLVACWCCFEEDVHILFREFKEDRNIDDKTALKTLEQELGSSEHLAMYWTYIVSGYVSRMKLKKPLYEYGLNQVFESFKPFVEAVEFFMGKISLENKFNFQRNCEIIMETAVRAARLPYNRHPEVFEFCISQMNPRMYPELLQRDAFRESSSLLILQDMLRLDLFQHLLDSFTPDYVNLNTYYQWLKFLSQIEEDSEYYANAKVNLFMRVWMKEGFDSHRFFVLMEEMTKLKPSGLFLVPFVRKNYMEPVWAVLNKAKPHQIEIFMKSDPVCHMRSILESRRDTDSITKLFSYIFVSNEIPSTSQIQANSFTAPTAKRLRTE